MYEGPRESDPSSPAAVSEYMGPSTALIQASMANGTWAAKRLIRLLFAALGLEAADTFEAVVDRYRREHP
jgi:hypothetical protein